MSISRHYNWTDVAELDDALVVFMKLDEAFDEFLREYESSSRQPYRVRTSTGSVSRNSRTQLGGAVDSLGGSLRSLEVWYDGLGDNLSANLEVQSFPAVVDREIGCSLYVHGDDEIETNGLFVMLRNRMDAEINRQWPKPNTAELGASPASTSTSPASPVGTSSSPASPAVGTSNAGKRHWLYAALRHPIIAPLVVVAVLALATGLWKAYSG